MGFPFVHDLVNCLLKQHFQLRLLADVSVELGASLLQETSLVLHLLAQGLDHALVPNYLLFFGLDLAGWLVEQWSHLLVSWKEGLSAGAAAILHRHLRLRLGLLGNQVGLLSNLIEIDGLLIPLSLRLHEYLLVLLDTVIQLGVLLLLHHQLLDQLLALNLLLLVLGLQFSILVS